MREIKFRGKRVDNGEWVEGSLVNNVFFHVDTKGAIPYIINPYEYEEYDCMEDIGELAVEVAPETVGQFTGLHDKNGVEIYEGDIVMVRSGWNEKAVIIYSDELARFMAKFKKFGNKGISQETDFEVIGKIHEGATPCTSDTVE